LEGDHPEPLIALKKLIEAHFTTLGSNPELALVLQVHIRQSEQGIRQQVADMMRPYQQTLRRIIQLGQQTGVFLPAVDARIARRMIFGTIDETVNAWIYTGAKYDLTTLIEPVYATLLHGIGT
jgi:TetR/AcrR family fatty acid metabolism transcriptional regulator